jgi:hypothetical protein
VYSILFDLTFWGFDFDFKLSLGHEYLYLLCLFKYLSICYYYLLADYDIIHIFFTLFGS